MLPWIFGATAHRSIDQLIGRLSYIVYLNHILIGAVIVDLAITSYARVWAAIAAATIIALLCHIGIERQIDRWRKRRIQLTTAQIISTKAAHFSFAMRGEGR